ncbi:2-phospho-L-lactate guanylyltransferase [Luethyella okanaganae]|uniref:Phosphoenolpyruvate guanylyltransferase n=1 Tax=Luethyella okanaganae TaxID=69372 RepID=A0ABW1VDE7_9MICO
MRSSAVWSVVVPVKRVDGAKTRLDADPAVRAALASAFARDTIRAVLAASSVARVFVVGDDSAFVAEPALLADGRLRIVPDPNAGMNAAIARGIAEVRSGRQDSAVTVLVGDLPALTAADLDAALAVAALHPLSMVPDASGEGTVMVAATAGAALIPSFGEGSAARHHSLGYVPLPVDPASTVRLDVDTAEALAAAVLRGVGPATTGLLRRDPSHTRWFHPGQPHSPTF